MKRRRKKINKAAKTAREKIKSESRCRNDDCVSGVKPDWHHAVPRSRFGKYDTTQHSIDNAVPLCRECHMLWHQNKTVLRRHNLTPSEVSFIIEHAGELFLDKHYPE